MGTFNLTEAESIELDYSPIAGSIDSEGCTSSKIWSIFLIAFGAGLVSLFTPCVFPMIPLDGKLLCKAGRGRRRRQLPGGKVFEMGLPIRYRYS